jgi:predicted amidohydrolase
MGSQTRITLVQFTQHQEGGSVLDRMEPFFERAVEYGSDLIVFPEYSLGNRISTDHPHVQGFLGLARKYRIYSVAGLVESHGERWATTALMVDRYGNILGRYLKTHPASGPPPHYWPPIPGHDDEARGILGDQFKVFHLDFAKVGILQCYDGYFPEAWACAAYTGAEIILWINGRDGFIEDAFCITAANCHGVVVAANISNGRNTGFADPWGLCLQAEGEREEMRLFPSIKEAGDACVHADIDLQKLRWHRKHLRQMHQRRPDLYGALVGDVKTWQNYPDIPWDDENYADFVNRSQL